MNGTNNNPPTWKTFELSRTDIVQRWILTITLTAHIPTDASPNDRKHERLKGLDNDQNTL